MIKAGAIQALDDGVASISTRMDAYTVRRSDAQEIKNFKQGDWTGTIRKTLGDKFKCRIENSQYESDEWVEETEALAIRSIKAALKGKS